MTRVANTSSYSVSSARRGGGHPLYGYYHGQEMSEFEANKVEGDRYGGSYNRNGGLKGVTPPQYSYNGDHGPASTPAPASAGKNGNHRQQASGMDPDYEVEDRGQWGSKAEFILSCVGFSVGIGNVWRFPYLAYQNGGGAFLVPYVILLILVGKPLYYMETAIGQFSRVSPLQIWECAPIAKGVGFAMIIISLIVSIYYNVIMSYAIIYIGASFEGIGSNASLPWTYCGDWANENCTDVSVVQNISEKTKNMARCRPEQGITENCTYIQSSTTQYWERFVLNITTGLGPPGDLGGFKYDLPLALLLSWIIVFLCLMKGVKSSGKVVYVTATFPYVILIALLVQGCLLDGATDGLYYLFVPKWEKLLEFTVWRKAAEQMFFSLGISWGGLIMFGSFNKFRNKIDIDASVVSSLDFVTSIIASIVVFSVLGHLAKQLGVDVSQVAEGGQGLAFVVYPQALSQLPVAWLWSILFFVMLFTLGLDSEFALLETAITALTDEFPTLRRHKVKTTFVACVSCYLLGLPCVSNSGQYVLDIMDTYGAGFSVLWVGIWELIGVMWIYGFRNFSQDIKLMLGHEPHLFWKVCWSVISPLFLIVIFLVSVFTWKEHKYAGIIAYPEWATGVGWALVGISAIQVPIWAIVMSLYYASKGRISHVVKPSPKWGPGDPEVRRAILDEQNGINRDGGKYAYDNQALGYEAYRM